MHGGESQPTLRTFCACPHARGPVDAPHLKPGFCPSCRSFKQQPRFSTSCLPAPLFHESFSKPQPPPQTLSTRRVTGTCQLSPTRRLASRKPNPEHPVGLPCPRSAFGPFRALSEAEEGPWPAWRPARRQGAPLHNPLVPNPNIAAPASSHACMPHRLWTPNQPPRGHDGLEHSPESQFLKLNVISTPRRGRAASSRRLRSLTA